MRGESSQSQEVHDILVEEQEEEEEEEEIDWKKTFSNMTPEEQERVLIHNKWMNRYGEWRIGYLKQPHPGYTYGDFFEIISYQVEQPGSRFTLPWSQFKEKYTSDSDMKEIRLMWDGKEKSYEVRRWPHVTSTDGFVVYNQDMNLGLPESDTNIKNWIYKNLTFQQAKKIFNSLGIFSKSGFNNQLGKIRYRETLKNAKSRILKILKDSKRRLEI